MKNSTVSIAEGKKSFSRLIQDVIKKKEEIVVTKRGKPLAVIVSYEEYRQSKKIEGYKKIMEVRKEFLKAGISASEVHRESRKQLEKRL
ncbi:MAG: type II toxin-antitoxin system Phd/YefM family antitoxin [Nitrospirae bacterium]|nr:type II toxin-antitoxin system Phd/YefM family antitoxin [Nitrospirota bacterium]MCL5236398.1 type II toxin-antitoxin system Phd/YefM family antitoxin [Nitrospirota bacterium]